VRTGGGTAGVLAGVAMLALGLGCGRPHAAAPAPFRFPADAFAFANETVWEYLVDAEAGRTAWRRREPRPPFSLRCGNMARAARQFRLHVRFDPALPAVDRETYRRLAGEVMRRDPRRRTPAPDPVVIPGHPDLRTFSRAHEDVVKDALAGPWHTYMQRGNWRMIFPFTARHQRRTAASLLAAVRRGEAPIVHVLRFPALTLNHVVLVFDAEETPAELRFLAYDPNDAARPIVLAWDRGARVFVYPRTPYFGGGPIRAYEIYDGTLH
jgi:hypothetical protein